MCRFRFWRLFLVPFLGCRMWMLGVWLWVSKWCSLSFVLLFLCFPTQTKKEYNWIFFLRFYTTWYGLVSNSTKGPIHKEYLTHPKYNDIGTLITHVSYNKLLTNSHLTTPSLLSGHYITLEVFSFKVSLLLWASTHSHWV